MFGLGGGEIVLILVLALVFVGPKKIPELAKGLGKGIREFQKAKNEMLENINEPEEISEKTNSNVASRSEFDYKNGNVFETTAIKRNEDSASSPHSL